MDQPTVLIVDDNPNIRRALRLLFDIEEYPVVGEAASGHEAAELAAALQPAFVMLDYLMPGGNGDEIARNLQRAAPGASIVAFSAYLDARPPWADAYMDKSRIAHLGRLLTDLRSERSRSGG